MELRDIILGFLDWQPMTGYELKRLFNDFDFLPWSGNNNQIYKALVALEKEGMVSKIIIPQQNLPAQKRFSVTPAGLRQLQFAVSQPPESEGFSLRSKFLLQLAWSECLTSNEIRQLAYLYQKQIESELLAEQNRVRRQKVSVKRTPREEFIWGMIFRNRIIHLQSELSWLNLLLGGLSDR